ncbi:MAG: hypothetical protein NWF04_03790 [Candidatus Bathyarchaeota archaeon]|nr:hypothetical protein [Candidatus Bathyarchaeota archaeon]
MLSKDCYACPQLKACEVRYQKVQQGGKVYCPNGKEHSVDTPNMLFKADLCMRLPP